ncbi:MAG: sodium:solute symporter family protein [Gemmatimonadetes bacterium]|nr:sodium:solute symporter family protein [Gemmatimonadota bacterium]
MLIATIVAYLGACIAVGVYYANKMQSVEDWAVAGRRLPWLIVLGTTAATLIGGGATVGSIATGYTVGLAIAIVTTGWHLQTIFAGLFIAPHFRRLPFYTVADFFGYRYGEFARILVSCLSLAFCIGVLGAQIVAMGRIAEPILGMPFIWAAIVGAGVVTLYSFLGGYWAVTQTDMLQFVILVFGFLTAALLGLKAVGGYEGLAAELPAGHLRLFGHWTPQKVLGVWLAMLLGETFSPIYVQRYYSAQDDRQARWGTLGAGLFMLFFLPITVVTLGMVARVTFPNITAPDQAWALLVTRLFPPALTGLFIAAALAAVMSSASSVLGSAATIVVRDFYQKLVRPGGKQHRLVRVARGATLIVAAVATVVALLVPNVLNLLLYSYNLWAPAIVLPVLIGVLWYRRETIYPVVTSMLVGLVTAVTWLSMHEPLDLQASVAGFLAALVTFVLSRHLLGRLALRKNFRPHELDPVAAVEG